MQAESLLLLQKKFLRLLRVVAVAYTGCPCICIEKSDNRDYNKIELNNNAKVLYMYTISNVRSISNLSIAYKRLITNQESTYKNYFRNLYTAYNFSVENNIKELSKRVKAGYIPSQPVKVFMPKSNGLSRMYTLLSVEDQIVYQAYCNIIAEAVTTSKVKARFRKSVFGNLYAGKNSEFFYLKWQDSYKAFTKAIIKAHQNKYDYIANFDLTACYDSINHELIKRTLIEHNISEVMASSFINLLKKWESPTDNELGSGIPQGPISSGIIAEAILSKYDSYMEELQKEIDFKYFRYVDDIKILAKDQNTADWVLFLLDVKSKELGLFPQSSKINTHRISNINDEIKRISLPLYSDELASSEKPEVARNKAQRLINSKSGDITTLRRLLGDIECNHKNNRLFIRALELYPNLIHSFAFYVSKYPRVLPLKIGKYIVSSCADKTQQFASGLLLRGTHGLLNENTFANVKTLAEKMLQKKRKRAEIIDPLYKAELIGTCITTNLSFKKYIKMYTEELNWWERQEVLSILDVTGADAHIKKLIKKGLSDDSNDVAIIAARRCIEAKLDLKDLSIASINNSAQITLQKAGIIKRKRKKSNQVNSCIGMIVSSSASINWKKLMGYHYEALEDAIFLAQTYWSTDITSFVNIWDTIDDTICDALSMKYKSVIGGYTIGKIGSIATNHKLSSELPQFYKMCAYIHELRLSSPLSHMYITSRTVDKSKWCPTRVISSKERKEIKRCIESGLDDLASFLKKH